MLKLKIFAPQTPFSIHFSHGMETSVVKKCSLLKLSYVWIFTSRIFLNKKKLSGLLSLSLSELEITITTIPIDPFVVILSQFYKGTSKKDIRNDFTILYVRDPIL